MAVRRCLLATAVAAVAAVVPGVDAQNPTGPGAARAAGGRRAVVTMTLASPAFSDGGAMPERHSQPGRDTSPPLEWSGAPDSIASFVLLVHDVDAVTGNGTDGVLHWLVWNIPGTATGLREGIPAGAQLPDGTRQVSVSGPYYRGPAAPASGPVHHYLFELFALDAALDVPAVAASPTAIRAAVLAAMAGHVRGKGAMIARYRRSP